MTQTYPRVFSPIQLGPKVARNRIWMTAHATEFSTDHTVSQTSADYYGERARGGVAVITMEASAVHPTTQPRRGVIRAYDPSVVDSYRRVADAVHPHGSLLLAQLWHRGRQSDGMYSRLPTWAPSPIPDTVYREVPHEMSIEEIDELVDYYVTCAKLAVEGGLDGVEIHGIAHGYLIGQFLSPATNHRNDEYGGSRENRLRLLHRIVDAIREAVPDDRIVGIRINGDDGEIENGLRNQDWVEIATELDRWGKLDYISVSQGTYADRMLIYGTSVAEPAGYEIDATHNIKKAVGSTPIVVVGRISTPEMAEEIVASGKADFVGMARQLIADPMWPRKAQEGRSDDIRPCIGANYCMQSVFRGPMTCIHNPSVGREREYRETEHDRAATTRQIAVIGGGPAGLRAALTASERGHAVTLFEKSDELGGQVNLLARADAYREWTGVTDWLQSQLARRNVRIEHGHQATISDLDGAFDAVVLATGSTPIRHGWTAASPARWAPSAPTVPGADQWNVYTPHEVLGGTAQLLRSMLIVDDLGDRQALITAEYAATHRQRVHLISRYPQIGHVLSDSHDLGITYGRLRRLGVTFGTNVDLAQIDEDKVTIVDVHTGEPTVLDNIDSVVLVLGGKADDSLAHDLRAHDPALEIHLVGDCLAPRRIFNAIYEGEQAARAL